MPVPLLFRSATRDSIVRVDNTQNGQVFNFNIGFAADTMIIDPDLWILTKNKTTLKVPPPVDGNSVVVAPNPSSGQLQIRLSGTSSNPVKIDMINSLGQVVYSNTVEGNTTVTAINTLKFSTGVYWIRVTNDKDIKTTRQVLVGRK